MKTFTYALIMVIVLAIGLAIVSKISELVPEEDTTNYKIY